MKQGALSRCVAALAAAGFLWTVALSASPALHERVHNGASGADHSCAVTFVRSGNVHHVTTPALSDVHRLVVEVAAVPDLTPHWVPSPFLTASVFEHGPPDGA